MNALLRAEENIEGVLRSEQVGHQEVNASIGPGTTLQNNRNMGYMGHLYYLSHGKKRTD